MAVTYEPIAATGIERENICSVPPGVLKPPLDAVQVAFRCSANKKTLPLELTLSLVGGATECGNPSATFACERNGRVELDVEDFSFKSTEPARQFSAKGQCRSISVSCSSMSWDTGWDSRTPLTGSWPHS